jgi:hypothetical protein
MIGRFIVLNTLGLSLLIAAYLMGGLDIVLTADHVYATPVLSILSIIGLGLVVARRHDDAQWIADKLPVLALIGTVLGILLAIHGIQDLEAENARMKIFTDVSHSLVANMLGMIGYFWLELVIRVCKHD